MPDQTFNITVNVAEANILLQALAQLPLAQVLDLFTKLKDSFNEQAQAAAPQ